MSTSPQPPDPPFEADPSTDSTEHYDWQSEGMPYFSLGFYLRRRFGRPVRKACIDARLGCPNRDGRVSSGGCIFCDPAAFCPARRDNRAENTADDTVHDVEVNSEAGDFLPVGSVTKQIDSAVAALRPADRETTRMIAYFQPGTNTYGPLDRLESLYREAIEHPRVVGLAVGTRPDCLDGRVMELLARIARDTWLSVELGIQSLDDAQLRWMNRGHDAQTSRNALTRCRQARLRVCAHVILGLPGQAARSVTEMATELGCAGIASVKIHNLHVVRDTRLAELYESGELKLPAVDEYVDRVADFLEHLPPTCIVERLVGDAPSEYLLAPLWCQAKGEVRQSVIDRLKSRGTRQGSKWAGN